MAVEQAAMSAMERAVSCVNGIGSDNSGGGQWGGGGSGLATTRADPLTAAGPAAARHGVATTGELWARAGLTAVSPIPILIDNDDSSVWPRRAC
uniref:Uncharacterized protein n=1 Tax=Oryza sativa subsp. japonica TaxID=39947 RepID=Q6YUN6_ORYSJ|nr:hypothetical protein [Oryza sativa Japonica Group]BAD17558.1 hypothetical protein [Oryza sativa Japonica Group]